MHRLAGESMSAIEASYRNRKRDAQESISSDSVPTSHSPQTSSAIHPSLISQSHLDTASFPQSISSPPKPESQTMSLNSDFSWDMGTSDAETLFPEYSNFALSQQSFQPQVKPQFDYYGIVNDPEFEGWASNTSANQQESFSRPDFNPTSQPQQDTTEAFPPSAFQFQPRQAEVPSQIAGELPVQDALDVHTSIEQPQSSPAPSQHDHGPFMYGLGLGMGYNHYPSQRSSETPLLSEFSGGDRDEPVEREDEEMERPYAHLIWKALLSTPDHSMQLQDIYNWIQTRTYKVKDKTGPGWRNSIRHNLSMNQAFEKATAKTKAKKGGKNTWRLVDKFARSGPESTTRYRRKEPNFKRPRKSANPAPQRQASGSKGGQAARRAAEQRRSARLREPQATQLYNAALQQQHDFPQPPRGMPYFSPSVALSADAQGPYASHHSSPYPEPDDIYGQSLPFPQGTAQSPEQFLHHQALLRARKGKQVMRPRDLQRDQQIASSGPYASSHDSSPVADSPWVGSAAMAGITFEDLGDRTLFAGPSSASPSDLNSPRTPSSMGSGYDGFAVMGSGVGIDPSPY